MEIEWDFPGRHSIQEYDWLPLLALAKTSLTLSVSPTLLAGDTYVTERARPSEGKESAGWRRLDAPRLHSFFFFPFIPFSVLPFSHHYSSNTSKITQLYIRGPTSNKRLPRLLPDSSGYGG